MQQVNLYLPEFRPNREPLRSHHMLWGAVVLLVLLCLYSVYDFRRNSQLRDEISHRNQEILTLEQQLTQLATLVPQDQGDKLRQDIENLEDELQRRREIAQGIGNESQGQTPGFSAQLIALARQSTDNLSLSAFSLQRGGRFVEMQGLARNPEDVPAYLQRLRNDTGFEQTGFGALRVEKSSASGPLSFDVSRQAGEPDGRVSRGAATARNQGARN